MEIEISINNRTSDIQRMSEPVPNALFIEGGGTRGVYAIGILKFLFEPNNYLNLSDVSLFGGTSVGSFIATALSIGYNKRDIIDIISRIDITGLIDSKYKFPLSLYRLLSGGHLYKDDVRSEIVSNFLNFKIDDINRLLNPQVPYCGKDLTFGHLSKLIKLDPTTYKHLIINAVDISCNKQIFFSTLESKWSKIRIYDAILASSAIPFVFPLTSLYYDHERDRYNYDNWNRHCLLADGGIAYNSPLDYFLTNTFDKYKFWVIKFTSSPQYYPPGGMISTLQQVVTYLLNGKNKIHQNLIEDMYQISTINLKLSAGVFDTYTSEQILDITNIIYNKCVSGELTFD